MKSKRGFMCAVDYEYHIEGDSCFVYSSLRMLKDERKCVEECGALEVVVKPVKWVMKQKLLRSQQGRKVRV